MSKDDSYNKNGAHETKVLLHWKNRKAYSLVLPSAFLRAAFSDQFTRSHKKCIARATVCNGIPTLYVLFLEDLS